MLTLRLAWRNLWRNRRRTLLTVAALTLNTAGCIVTYGLMVGVLDKMQRNATRLAGGDLQIHAPDYRQNRSLHRFLADPDAILADARRAGLAAAPRAYGQGLLARDGRSAGAWFWGVDPAAEREAFELPGKLAAGTYLGPAAAAEVVLGRRLAQALRAEVGDDVVAVVQAADGSLGNERFRVAGIFASVGDGIDRQAAVLHGGDFGRLFAAEGRVHEIALHGRSRPAPSEVAAVLRAAHPGAEVLAWREIWPHFAGFLEYMDRVAGLYAFIFALVAGLGIVSTMLMATYERLWEFGVLKALGASPWRIVRDVAVESMLLALLATLAGLAAGAGVLRILQARGIDLSRFFQETLSFSGVAFDPVLRPALAWDVLWPPAAVMWAAALAAALYPAVQAARTRPARAMAPA